MPCPRVPSQTSLAHLACTPSIHPSIHPSIQDESTGLYDVRTRYLDPGQGRFIKLDTVGILADAVARGNGYVFAGSQPYTSGDPTGMATVKFSTYGNLLNQRLRHD